MTKKKVTTLTIATLLISSALISMGDAIVIPLQAAIKQTFAKTPGIDLLTNYVLVFNALFIAIGASFVGLLLERFSKRAVFLTSLLIYGIAGTAGLYLNDIYLLIASRAFMGLSIAGIMTTLYTLIADYFEVEKRGRFLGLANGISLWGSVAFLYIVAPLATKSWHQPFILYGVAFIVLVMAVISIFDMPKEEPFVTGLAEEPVTEVATDTPAEDTPVGTPSYPKALIFMIYSIVFISITLVSLMFIKLQDIVFPKFTKTDIYYLITAIAVFLALGASGSMFVYARIKKYLHFQLIYAIIFVVIGIGFLLISKTNSYPVFLVGCGIAGLGYGFVAPNTSLWLMQITPPVLVARFMGFFTSLFFLAIFISPNLTAIVLSYVDVPTTFLIYGIVLLVLSVGLLLHGLVLVKKAKASLATS